MRQNISKSTHSGMLNLGKTRFFAVFSLESAKRLATAARLLALFYPENARKWRGIHLSQPKREGNVRYNGQFSGRKWHKKGATAWTRHASPERAVRNHLWESLSLLERIIFPTGEIFLIHPTFLFLAPLTKK